LEGEGGSEGMEEIRKKDSPLNSNRRRDKALILALIMCGVAAVKPAATIVIYSSAFAWTVSGSQHRTGEASLGVSAALSNRNIPSWPTPSSSSPSTAIVRVTLPPSAILLPITTSKSNPASRAFSLTSLVPNTASDRISGIKAR